MTDPRIAARRNRLLELVREHQIEHGFPPTYRELAEALQVSRQTVLLDVRALLEAGQLHQDRSGYRARTLTVAERKGGTR